MSHKVKTENLVDTLRNWVTSANPGFVTQQDLARVEARLDDILELVQTLEDKLASKKRRPG